MLNTFTVTVVLSSLVLLHVIRVPTRFEAYHARTFGSSMTTITSPATVASLFGTISTSWKSPTVVNSSSRTRGSPSSARHFYAPPVGRHLSGVSCVSTFSTTPSPPRPYSTISPFPNASSRRRTTRTPPTRAVPIPGGTASRSSTVFPSAPSTLAFSSDAASSSPSSVVKWSGPLPVWAQPALSVFRE